MDTVNKLNDLAASLGSAKATTRKEGYKSLERCLESQEVLRLLDTDTARLGDGKPTATTWPGLAHVLLATVQKDAEAAVGRQRGPDVVLPRVVKRFFQACDESARHGSRAQLLRVAQRLFKSMVGALQLAGLGSPLGQALSTVLRQHLLPVRQYCAKTGGVLFQDLLNLYLDHIEQLRSLVPEDGARPLTVLQLLLLHFPGKMQPEFRAAVLEFFARLLHSARCLREDRRAAGLLLACANAFLARNGLDSYSLLPELHAAMEGLLKLAWDGHDPRLHEAAVSYLRLQLALGGAAAPASWGAAARELARVAAAWTGPRLALSRQQEGVVELAAAAAFGTASRPAAAEAGDQGRPGPAAKRRRVAEPWARLAEDACGSPHWALAVALLLRRQGHRVPPGVLQAWGAPLAGALRAEVGAEAARTAASGSERPLESRLVLCLLAALTELAGALARHGLLAAAQQPPWGRGRLRPELEAWRELAADAMQWALAAETPPIARAEGLRLLSAAARLGLAGWMSQQPAFWRGLQDGPLTGPALRLLAAVFASPAAGRQGEAVARSGMPAHILGSQSAAEEPQAAAAALLALLGGAAPACGEGAAARWWQAPGGGSELDATLASLMRGEEWVAAQALRDAEARQAPASQEAGGQAAGSAWAAVASALQDRLHKAGAGGDLRTRVALSAIAAQLLQTQQHAGCLEALCAALDGLAGELPGLAEGGAAPDEALLAHLRLLFSALAAPTLQAARRRCAGLVPALASGALQPDQPQAAQRPAQDADMDADLDGRAGAEAAVSGSPAQEGRPRGGGSLACVQLALACGRADPAGAAASLLDARDRLAVDAQLPASAELRHALLEAAGELITAAPAPQLGLMERLAMLLLNQQFSLDGSLAVLRLLEAQAVALRRWQAGGGDTKSSASQGDGVEAGEVLGDLHTLLVRVADLVADVDRAAPRSGAELRLALASAAAALLAADADADALTGQERERLTGLLADAHADPCYETRRGAVGLCRALLAATAEPKDAFESLLQRYGGRHAELHEEQTETLMLALGECAAAEPRIELDALQLLLGLTGGPQARALAAGVMQLAARRLGYASLAAYAGYHLQPLAYCWLVVQGWDLSDLLALRAVLGEAAGSDDFLRRHASVLVPCVLLKEASARVLQQAPGRPAGAEEAARLLAAAQGELQQCAAALDVSPRRAVEQSYAHCLALALAHHSTEEGRQLAQALVNGVIDAHLEDGERNALLGQQIVAVCGRALQLAVEAHDPQPPLFGVEAVLDAVGQLANQPNAAANQRVLQTQILDDNKHQRLLVHVHEALAGAQAGHHVRARLGAAAAFMRVASARLHTPPTLRYLLHILLGCLAFPEAQAEVGALLGRLLAGVLNAQGAATLGPLLQPLLFRLTECAEAQLASGGGLALDHPAVTLILRLTVQAPRELHPHLRLVELLPEHEAFAAARRLQQRLRSDVSLAADVAGFAARVRAMPAGPRARALDHLGAQLHARKPELLAALAGGGGQERAGLERAAWQLAADGRELGDARLAALAGRLLAALGPLPPEAVAFGDAAADGGPATGGAEAVPPQAVQLLAGLAVDEDPHVVDSAQATLRLLLTAAAGKALLEAVDQTTRGYLAIFAQGDELPPPDFSAQLADERWALGSDALWVGHASDYGAWVCRLAFALAIRTRDPLLRVCSRMVQLQASFAELLLPRLLLALAQQGSADAGVIARQLSRHVLSGDAPAGAALGLCLGALNLLRSAQLDALQHKRRKQDGGGAGWPKVYWLDVPYLDVAAAALRNGASMTALLYVEEWCKDSLGVLRMPSGRNQDEAGAAHLLAEAHNQTREADGMAAVAGASGGAGLLPLLEREGDWAAALQAHDLRLAAGPADARRGVLTALQRLGCAGTAAAFLAGLAGQQRPGHAWLEEAQAQAAWQMGGWQALPSGQPPPPAAFHATVCHCLQARAVPPDAARPGARAPRPHPEALPARQALAAGDSGGCQALVQDAGGPLVESLGVGRREAAAAVNPVTVQLQVLEALAEAAQLCAAGGGGADALQRLQEVWAAREAAAGAGGRFELRSPLAAAHKSVLSAVGGREHVPGLLLRTAAAARKAGCIPQAVLALHELQGGAVAGGVAAGLAGRVEEAKLRWAQARPREALDLAKELLGASTGSQEPLLVARLTTMVGKWQAARSESSAAVLERLQSAAGQLAAPGAGGGAEWAAAACRAEFRLAQCAAGLHAGARAQLASPEWAVAEAVLAHKRREIAALQAQLGAAASEATRRDAERHIRSLAKTVAEDEAEEARLQTVQEAHLWTAVDAFVRCLASGEAYDVPASFRLVQLWLDLAARPEMNVRMAAAVEHLPSHKFLPLLHQIAARMGAADRAGFQAALQGLMARLGRDHPFHTLYQLFALRNGSRVRAAGGAIVRHAAQDDKIRAAAAVIDRVAAARRQAVVQVGALVDAYCQLAALPPVAKDAKAMPLPAAWRRGLPALDRVPVVSKELPVDRGCAYEGLATVAGFGDTITFVGGINKPKLITCTDSAGRRHRQLVKAGNDDLRQDAVMQQFFSLINHLLRGGPATRARQLDIRTYKVVPFAPNAGLLEWVEQTLPLSDFLLGESRDHGAHARYKRPGDWSFLRCHQAMYQAPPDDKLRTFKQVCARFRPCLHAFFLETFRQPAAWFARRLAYTRATAAVSVAGWLIGLGDRHSANLLLDRATAQVVHIDLGIAFEQGRFLNTPEVVPFRLTRDVVDGMGATGVEGVMTRCCEETLRELRRHKDLLATIVQVLIHDPLYKWALTARAAAGRQQEAASPRAPGWRPGEQEAVLGNADAERALLRIRQKLDGLDGGDGAARGVEGQVQQLLQEAQDPALLCKMYVGWAPWV